jgi:hypothetical protein
MYVRYTLIKIAEAVMALLGFVVYPIAYLLRKYKFKIFWPFENADEGSDVANWYGDRNWRNGQGFDGAGALKRFWISYKWGALRNPTWNFKNWIGASARGEKSNVVIKINEGDGSGLLWMNKMYRGKKLAYFDVDDSKIRHFRYSFTRPLKWWSPWRLFYDNINFMAGTDDKRYLLKLRFFK